MSVMMSVTFDPMDEGVSPDAWASFCAGNGLVAEPGNWLWYQGEVEVDYLPEKRTVTFSTTGGQDARDNLIMLALGFWKKFSGKLYASGELQAVIVDLVTQSML